MQPSAPRSRDGNRTWTPFIFLFLLIWQIVLVWIFPHFATQDGPSHLYNAALIRRLHDPAWHRLSEFYHMNSRLVPNWLTYAVLAGLYPSFSPATAEKILVTGYFVFFPLSLAYVFRTLARDIWPFAIWGLVLASNLFIAMGFYNFCYSLIFFLLCFGYWMRRNTFGLKQLITLCALASLLYFSHAVGFFMAAFFIGATALYSALEEGRFFTGHKKLQPILSSSAFIKRVLVPQLAFLPCVAIFLASSTGSQPQFDPGRRSVLQRLLIFRDLHVLTDTRGVLAILQMCLIGGFLICGSYSVIKHARKQHELVTGSALGILAAMCLFLSAILPWSISGGGMLPERMAWFALCAAVLWISSSNLSKKFQQGTVLVSILTVILGLVGQTEWRYQLSPLLNAYDDTARLLEPQKTILLLCYCNPADNSKMFASLRIRPLEHAGDLAALKAHAISLDNYEAMGSAFPVEYNSSVNPERQSNTISAASVSSKPQDADIANYESRSGKTVDYVLLWGSGPDAPHGGKSILDQQLEEEYELTYQSSAPATLRLFKRK